MNVGSLFSGIGGIELGLEWTGGFRTIWQCEQHPWARRVLARHWPGVPIYEDAAALPFAEIERPDVLCGGFPCQDISQAGAGAGLAGARSGLWFAYLEAIRALRPRYVIVENVAILTQRGLDVVLGGLAARGYDAEWDCLPASAFGAPHRRDRLFLVAYPHDGGRLHGQAPIFPADRRLAAFGEPGAGGPDVAHTDGVGRLAGVENLREREPHAAGRGQVVADSKGIGRPEERLQVRTGAGLAGFTRHRWWAVEPDVGRVAHGVPSRVDRLRGLGNAVVPHVAEWIGQRILERERVMNAGELEK